MFDFWKNFYKNYAFFLGSTTENCLIVVMWGQSTCRVYFSADSANIYEQLLEGSDVH